MKLLEKLQKAGKPQLLIGPSFRHSISENSLGQFLFSSAEKNDGICQIDASIAETETYNSVKKRSVRVAIAMTQRGITSRDVIVICASNSLDNTIPILATLYLGAKIANLDPSLSLKYTKYLLSSVKPKIIFVDEAAVGLIEHSLAETDLETHIVVFGLNKKYISFSDFIKPQDQENVFRPTDVEIEEIAVVVFSSGSTGLPKVICHSHRSFIFIILTAYQAIQRENFFHFISFFSLVPMIMLCCAFKWGTYRVFCKKPSADEVLSYIEKYKIGIMFTLPIFTYKLSRVSNPKRYDTSSLKMYMFSGSSLSSTQIQKINDLFPTAFSGLVYGLTEIGLSTSFHSKSDKKISKKKVTSSGKVGAGLRMKIVNIKTEELLTPNHSGEIRVKSISLMKGYYNQDSSQYFDSEGFFKTGDVGYYDEDECIYVLDRIKEIFMYEGNYIMPSFIENVLLEHPAIKEAVVFGVPDQNGEDAAPAALVVLREHLSGEEIDAYIKSKLEDSDRLRGGITFLNALPLTPTGKINRKEVRNKMK